MQWTKCCTPRFKRRPLSSFAFSEHDRINPYKNHSCQICKEARKNIFLLNPRCACTYLNSISVLRWICSILCRLSIYRFKAVRAVRRAPDCFRYRWESFWCMESFWKPFKHIGIKETRRFLDVLIWKYNYTVYKLHSLKALFNIVFTIKKNLSCMSLHAIGVFEKV